MCLIKSTASYSPTLARLKVLRSLIWGRACLSFFLRDWTSLGIHGHVSVSSDKPATFDTVIHHLFSVFFSFQLSHSYFCSKSQVTGLLMQRLALSLLTTSGPVCYTQGGRVGHRISDLVGGTAHVRGDISG